MTAIEQLKSGLTIGHFGLGIHGNSSGTPAQQTHDGDTVSVRGLGNFSVRFLAIDTPEISFPLPDAPDHFISIGDSKWKSFLEDPFAPQYHPLDLDAGLTADLKNRLGTGAAANHFRHAKKAREELLNEIEKDKNAMGWNDETFEFFLAFAHEVTDRYGRLLAYINRKDPSASRPADYNTRQLEKAAACMYNIWANVGSSAGQDSLSDRVIEPFTANEWATRDKYMAHSRKAISDARGTGLGIFDQQDPLRIEPFEIRYLAGRRAPDRWVIDLSKHDDVLSAPQQYYRIKMEDRLFVPEEYVTLFEAKGWRRQTAAAPQRKVVHMATASKAAKGRRA